MKNYRFCWDFEVRDYECDLTGIVNNANYQHYLEHTRHLFLKGQGVDFQGWYKRGITLVVVRIELDFLHSLKSGDQFWVGLNPYRISRLRLGFDQDIFCKPDNQPVLKGKVVASAVNRRGRPEVPEELVEMILASSQEH
jgi:acyl-CoA thioester hydrolase